MRTKKTAALADFDRLNRVVALWAGPAGSSVNIERLLKVARLALFIDKVFQCGAALGNGLGEYGLDAVGKFLITLAGNPPGLTVGMNAGQKKRFTGVNIAYADDNAAVHDEIFDRHDPVGGALI